MLCDEITRVVTRYLESGIKGVASGTSPLGSGIKSHGIRISGFFVGSGIELYLFCGMRVGTKICHSFGIKDQKFGYKNGIGNGKTYSRIPISLTSKGNENWFEKS